MKGNEKLLNRIRRKKRIRKNVTGSASRPRLSVFRSNQHIYAQIINDAKGETLVSVNDFAFKESKKKKKQESAAKEKTLKSTKKDKVSEGKFAKKVLADMVGQELAKKAVSKKIKKIVFDRSGYRYHGIVKALAEAARKGGLEF